VVTVILISLAICSRPCASSVPKVLIHPAEYPSGVDAASKLTDITSTQAAKDLGECLVGDGRSNGVDLIGQHPSKVQADDARPVLEAATQDLGITAWQVQHVLRQRGDARKVYGMP
jgi:hypothetical protein